MRPNKFRVWHKKINMMLDVWKLHYDGSCEVFEQEVFDDGYCGQSTDENGTHDCFSRKSGNQGFISANNCIVMQYTGLKDKNGKEIFFDDIILFSFDDSEEQEHYSGSALVVESMNGGAAILHDWDDGAMELVAVLEGGEIEDIWPGEEHWEFEVIGNRWENPELIKTDL